MQLQAIVESVHGILLYKLRPTSSRPTFDDLDLLKNDLEKTLPVDFVVYFSDN